MRGALHLLYLVPFIIAQIGDPFGGDPGIFDELLGAIQAELQAIFAFLWAVQVYVANFLLGEINFNWNFEQTLFHDIQDDFKWLWTNVVKVALTKLKDEFDKITQFLHKIFDPVIQWLHKLRSWLDFYFNLYVKPVLSAIQTLRKILQIFRLLGFKWAIRLDARLGQIENAIIKVWTDIRQSLNQAISWVQLIVNPSGILRRNPLFAALLASAPELKNLVMQAEVHLITNGEADSMNRNRTWFQPTTGPSNQSYYAQGQLPPDMQAARQEFLNAKTNSGDIQPG